MSAEANTKIKWQQMDDVDLPFIKALADTIHIAYPEDISIFQERLRLYPIGCHVLISDDELAGYCIAHPWYFGQPPALNSLLGALPIQPDTFYLHDLAIAPHMRGKKAARPLIASLVDQAKIARLPNLSLTAVSGSAGFWQKHGFRLLDDFRATKELGSYGTEAHFMMHPLAI
jgi:GNAT superfamily N-acetyltransferase